MKRVYYSFHYEKDYWRLQQIRKNPAVQGQSIYAADEWENLKWEGDYRVKTIIDKAMQNRHCVVVLIGTETFDSRWVQYEIEKAWSERKGLFGIYIHNLKDGNGNRSEMGRNPFEIFSVNNTSSLANYIKVYDPPRLANPSPAQYIQQNLARWVDAAMLQARQRR